MKKAASSALVVCACALLACTLQLALEHFWLMLRLYSGVSFELAVVVERTGVGILDVDRRALRNLRPHGRAKMLPFISISIYTELRT